MLVLWLFVRTTEPVKQVLPAKDTAVYVPLDSPVTSVNLVRKNVLCHKNISDSDNAGTAILSNLALMPSSSVALWVRTESSNSTTLLCVIVGRSFIGKSQLSVSYPDAS